jgi:dimethylaniline monooxygenase (N-oxide forming)
VNAAERAQLALFKAIVSLPRPVLARMPAGRAVELDGHRLDPQLQTAIVLAERMGRPPFHTVDPIEARRVYEESVLQVAPRGPEMAEVSEADADGVPVRIYRPEGVADAAPAAVYYHGGGGVIGNLHTCDHTCRALAATGGCVVVSVDYRLAPEHPFPAAVDDALAAYRWVIDQAGALGIDPARVAVAGDSMGGCLAAVIAIACRDGAARLPAFQLLIYPLTDFTLSMPSTTTFADGYLLSRADMLWFREHYLPDGTDPADGRVSPLFADDLSGLPPALVATCGFDPLRDEGRRYADRLEAAGVPVRYRCYSGLTHAFLSLTAVVDAAAEATGELGRALAEALGQPERASRAGRRVLEPLPRVCLIGAGSSGLPVLKALRDAGVPVDCYERSDQVGGNWVFKNKNRMSSAYRSLHINTSRDRMQYADYPMPADYPDFPGHELIARYFDDYVDHFDLRHAVHFETGVEKVAPLPDGRFRVRLDDGTERTYEAVAVANGHHWDPQWPDPPFPGHFDGVELHSHHYIDPREPHDLTGKRVVVLGMGNSAMDIACELSRPGVAARVFLAARRGAHVIPHYLLGKPLDQGLTLPPWLPWRLRRGFATWVYKMTVGDLTRFGLPEPDHPIGHAHPTISSDLLPRLGRGDLTVKPNLAELCGDRVRFADGSVEPVDAIVYCTGYRVSFPFFDAEVLSAPGNDLPLYRRVFEPGTPGLFFIGLLQPLGAVMPLAEAQGKWIAAYLTGEYHLPPGDQMRADMARERAAMFRRYVRSRRHTMQVDFDDYLRDLDRERQAGRARAAAAGHRLPIPVRPD